MGLGTIFVVTPAIGWALPMVWPIVMSAAAALGYKAFTSTADDAPLRGELTKQMKSLRTVSFPMENVVADMIADEVGREQVLRFTKDEIMIIFKRNTRGKFLVEVMGPDDYTALRLRALASEFAAQIVQQFAYNKLTQEMERRGANVVGEEVNENGDIVLVLRRWGVGDEGEVGVVKPRKWE